ncbi:MAG TPA: hypothetical protein VGE29_10720 [Prosthecobacter sp.]
MSSLAKKRFGSQKLLESILADPSKALLIHYACEDFANRPDGSSARVTSIAVRHLNNALTHSFSVHLSAERLGVPYNQIKDRYAELETDLLTSFNDFVSKHLSFIWVHWSMRDSNYGFPAIYHRCRLRGIIPNEIPATSLVDLARCLIDIYGNNYIEHPRMTSLIARNKISDLGLLVGAEESKAFEQGDYVSVNRSTLRKVDIFESIISKAHAGTLMTNYRWIDIYGKSPKDVIHFLKEHWIYTFMGMSMLAVSIIKLGLSLYSE